MAALAKRGENVLSSFESLETQLNSETSAITSLCSSLNYATSASQRSAIGAEIVSGPVRQLERGLTKLIML